MGHALVVPALSLAVLCASVSLPPSVHAFWPFSANADAATNTVPDASMDGSVLEAPTNPNANAQPASPLPTSGDTALVPYTGPNGSPGDSVVTPASESISTYLVRPGDTLSEIAAMYGVSVNTIIWANDLRSAKDVHPGDTLLILPVSGVEHTVAKGDTLKSLASRYSGDAGEIATYNGLDPGVPLVVGSAIIIPGGEVAPVPVPKVARKTPGKRGIPNEPYRGGSGAAQNGYWTNPLPGGLIWQGIHGWNAVDIAAARGTPIHAAASGIVVVARNNGGWNGGYGNYVVISHDNGTQTLYAHMTHAVAVAGEGVGAGQVIGYVGTTGLATGPHLHFEVRGAANPFRNCPLRSACTPQ